MNIALKTAPGKIKDLLRFITQLGAYNFKGHILETTHVCSRVSRDLSHNL